MKAYHSMDEYMPKVQGIIDYYNEIHSQVGCINLEWKSLLQAKVAQLQKNFSKKTIDNLLVENSDELRKNVCEKLCSKRHSCSCAQENYLPKLQTQKFNIKGITVTPIKEKPYYKLKQL